MPSEDRVNIILPEEDRELADRIAEKIGAGGRGRSAAIRYALRVAAAELGLSEEEPKKKKRRGP